MVELVRERQQILKHGGNRIYQMRWGYRKELEQVRAREAGYSGQVASRPGR